MRTTCSRLKTKIFPSPIFPVLALFSIASMTRSSMSSLIAASTFTFGRKATTYSAPRQSSVCPFCRPKPFTSVTVMPCTPIAERASRTSSSLNGLMIAVTSFIFSSPFYRAGKRARPRGGSERIRDEGDEAILAPVLALHRVPRAFGVGPLHVGTRVEAAAEVVGGPQLPHRVREGAVVLERLVAGHAVQRDLFRNRVIDRELE